MRKFVSGLPRRPAQLLRKLSWVAFSITLILIPVRYRVVLMARPMEPIWRDYTDFLLFASDVFMLGTLGLWLLSLLVERRRVSSGPFFLALPLAGLTGMAFISVLPSMDRALSLYHAVRLLLLGGFFLYIVNEVKSFRQLIFPVAAQAVIQAVIGIAQVLDQSSLGLQALGEYELNPAWRGVSIVWVEGERSLRAYGLSDHPNILGGCLAFAILLMLTYVISREENRTLPLLGALALSGVGLMVTYSRSAWLAFTSGVGLLGILLYRENSRLLLRRLVSTGAFMGLMALPFVWANLDLLGIRLGRGDAFQQVPAEVQSLGERQVLNAAANDVFIENAILGVGIGTMPQAVQERFPEFPTYYQPAHVVLLDVAGETGLFGALFYGVLLVGPWVALAFRLRRGVSIKLIGASGALLASSVVGLFDYYTWMLVPGRLWQWTVWGLWGAFYLNTQEEIE